MWLKSYIVLWNKYYDRILAFYFIGYFKNWHYTNICVECVRKWQVHIYAPRIILSWKSCCFPLWEAVRTLFLKVGLLGGKKKISQWSAVHLKRIWHVFGLNAVKYDHVASVHQASEGLAGLIFFLLKSLTRQSCKCRVTRKAEFDTLLDCFPSSQGKMLFVTGNSTYTWMDLKPKGRNSFTI